jgi:hypothetical protein
MRVVVLQRLLASRLRRLPLSLPLMACILLDLCASV